MATRVCMISYTHQAKDDRIYWKEGLSLASNGYDVSHIYCGENDTDLPDTFNIRLIGVKKKTSLHIPY